MSKKILNTQSVINELKGQSVFFSRKPSSQPIEVDTKTAPEVVDEGKLDQKPADKKKVSVTLKSKQTSDLSRELSSDTPLEIPRVDSHSFPTRDEIQGFSFRLRDEIKVKVQAEVPYQWQKELEEVARELDVKKLELYRYILGEFLGKV